MAPVFGSISTIEPCGPSRNLAIAWKSLRKVTWTVPDWSFVPLNISSRAHCCVNVSPLSTSDWVFSNCVEPRPNVVAGDVGEQLAGRVQPAELDVGGAGHLLGAGDHDAISGHDRAARRVELADQARVKLRCEASSSVRPTCQ